MALPIPMVFPATAIFVVVVVLVGHSDQIVHQGKLMLLLLMLLLLLLLLSAVLSFSSSTLVIVFTSAAAATSVCRGLVRIFQVSASGPGCSCRCRRRGPLLVAVLGTGRLAVGRVHLMLRARRVGRRRVVLGRHRAPRRRGQPRHVVGELLLLWGVMLLLLLLRGRSAVDLIRRGGMVRGTRLA